MRNRPLVSKFDQIYRSVLLSSFFSEGWGNPDQLQWLFDARHRLLKRDGCAEMAVLKDNTMKIVKTESKKHYDLLHGSFESPIAQHFPSVLHSPNDQVPFLVVRPKTVNLSSSQLRPAVIHLAMTGDHGFQRRQYFMANPLAKLGITSVIVENPFYGARKPAEQFRSRLRHVTDLFVMGGCLMLECHVLLQWLSAQGYGPLGITGISLGGHMASLAAGCYNRPVSLAPCLSWSTASCVFTEGVLSNALPWSLLTQQYHKYDLESIVPHTVGEYTSFRAGRDFVKSYSAATDLDPKIIRPCNAPDNELYNYMHQAAHTQSAILRPGHSDLAPELILKDRNSERSSDLHMNTNARTERIQRSVFSSLSSYLPFYNHTKDADYETKEFMRGVMDEFTHLGNFCKPLDLSLVVGVQAEKDAYIPRTGVTDLRDIWPGVDIRMVLKKGHVMATVFDLGVFRTAIYDSLRKQADKYYEGRSW